MNKFSLHSDLINNFHADAFLSLERATASYSPIEAVAIRAHFSYEPAMGKSDDDDDEFESLFRAAKRAAFFLLIFRGNVFDLLFIHGIVDVLVR
jgi:hypothetical protein